MTIILMYAQKTVLLSGNSINTDCNEYIVNLETFVLLQMCIPSSLSSKQVSNSVLYYIFSDKCN